MKTNKIITIFMMATVALSAGAKEHKVLRQWDIKDASMRLSDDKTTMSVKCDVDLSQLKVPSQEALLITPMIVSDTDTLRLNSIGIYGRSRYYHYLRQDAGMLSGQGEHIYKNDNRPVVFSINEDVAFEPWMRKSHLMIEGACYGCCFTRLGENSKDVAFMSIPPKMAKPVYMYMPAETEVVDSLEGSARIQFVVDRTEIRPELFDNYRELGKVTHSIDTVKNDPDITITEVWLKGFASPESPYSHNTDLARGRTEALRQYIQNLYAFPKGLVTTDYEPEDWAGLRKFVVESNISNKQGILDIIDRDMANLDEKEALIKKTYPTEYKFLKEVAYPPLRHTEYKVKYKVRRFYDVEEIMNVMAINPKKLTLNDFLLVANSMEPGSDEYNAVFALAARLHPESEIANLNAANAALESGDADLAAKYLANAGNSAEAEYSRALLKVLREDYAGALQGIQKAADAGLEGASQMLNELKEYLQK